MTVLIICILIVILLIGLFVNIYALKSIIKTTDQVVDFRTKYHEFLNKLLVSNNFDHSLYQHLIKVSTRIQRIMGGYAKIDYKPEFANYFIHNYDLILNTIPKFGQGDHNEFDIKSVDESLVRYLGYCEELIEENKKQISNPFIWFRDGMHEILSLPIYLFYWFGIIGEKAKFKIKGTYLFRLLSGIISVLYFISSIMTIFLGFDDFIDLLNRLFSK